MKRVLVLLFGLCVVAAACGGGSGSSKTSASEDVDPNGQLVIGENMTGAGFSQRLAPELSTASCDFMFQSPIFSTLVYVNPNTGKTAPGLAKSWDIVDSRSVKFELRPGLTFHDGSPLDATRAKDALLRNKAGRLGSTLTDFESITVESPTTFTIHLNADAANTIPVRLAFREGEISAPSSTDAHPIGAGPFKFVSQVVGDRLELEKFDGYWDAKEVRLQKVTFVNTGSSDTTGLNSLRSGEIDMMDLADTGLQAQAASDSTLDVETLPSLSYHKIDINVTKGPWSNLKFRQAMQYALDREALGDVLFGKGNYEVAWMPFPSWFSTGYVKSLADRYSHDVNKAKELIKESGLATPIKTTLLYPGGSASWQRAAEVIKAQWEAVGVDAELVPTTDGFNDWQVKKKTDTFLLLWPARPDPTVTIFTQFGEKQAYNTGNFTDPKLSAAITTIRGSSDENAVKKAYVDASTVIVDQAIQLPIAFPKKIWLHKKYVVGEFRMYETCQGVDLTKLAVTKAKS